MTSASFLLSDLLSRASLPAVDAEIVEIEVRLLHLPVREMLVASHGSHHVRELAVCRLRAENGSNELSGWGECSALPTANYWPETAASSFKTLSTAAPGLIGKRCSDALVGYGFTSTPMAHAAMEMAAVDLVLTAEDVPLAGFLGASSSKVAAGATIGIAAPEEVAENAVRLAAEGFMRLKIKVKPGHDSEVLSTVRRRLPSTSRGDKISLQIDANGSYRSDHVGHLVDLARLGVDVIEQPFAPNQLEAAQILCEQLAQRQLSTAVFADEAAATIEHAAKVVGNGAANGVVVKPSRLGGIDAALRLLTIAADRGFPVSAGGMLESGLGRHCLAAIAAAADTHGSTVTGDLSPARRWLADDPWTDIEMALSHNRAVIRVPQHPGVAPPPDQEKLDRYTVRHWSSSRRP